MVSDDRLVAQLKQKGLSCDKLKKLEAHERKDATRFRSVGFESIAKVQESSANKIKSLRLRVCKLS